MQSGIPEILLLLGFTALCAAMGRALLIRIGFDFQSTLQAVSFSSGLGLAMLSWTVLALGFLGGLSRTSAAVVAAVVSLLGIISLAYWVAPRIRLSLIHI